MKLKKFLCSLIYVVFAFLLLFVSVFSISASGTGGQSLSDSPLGGGGGIGSGFKGIPAPVPLTISYYRYLPTTVMPVDIDSPSDPLYSDWMYASFVFDPNFNYSWYGYNSSGSYFVSSNSFLPIGNNLLDTVTFIQNYSNFKSDDIDDRYSDVGLLGCEYSVSLTNTQQVFSSISIFASDFFSSSYSYQGIYSEFNFIIDYDYHKLYIKDNSNAFMKITYRRLNSSGSGLDYDYKTDIVPLDQFIYGDDLRLDPGNYLNSLNEHGYYHIKECYFVLPCSVDRDYTLTGEVIYRFDQMFLDPYSYVIPHSPRLELQDYTDWVTEAVSGFLRFEIFPGFYISGLLMVIIAFCCVMWFLKIFAGG